MALQGIPPPIDCEPPTSYADRVGTALLRDLSSARRKAGGIYPTPQAIADYMASLIKIVRPEVRLLDPGAGVGILTCAVCEHLAGLPVAPKAIAVDAYEVDRVLVSGLECVLIYLREYLEQRGVSLNITIKAHDFILYNAQALSDTMPMFPLSATPYGFDLAVANPPYFKLPKTDPRARAASAVVHGQPNIYALFMAVGASLLNQGGEFVFITPRSFTSGPYFHRFRERFFKTMRPTTVHVFGSRTDAFSRDEVLQENVILRAVRDDGWANSAKTHNVTVSSSCGIGDLTGLRHLSVPVSTALSHTCRDRLLRLPTTEADLRVVEFVDAWRESLHSLGLEISTGPVVPFRAVPHLAFRGTVPDTHAPLLWMQHVHPMVVNWPNGARKEQYISVTADSAPLLVADRNYVLVRRFSAKEQRRRLTAAPLLAGQLGSPVIGLENHLNFVYRPSGCLSVDEVWGIAALFNSSIMDAYFRVLNGNTQVSATELRSIPLPDHELICALGRDAQQAHPGEIDTLVSKLVGFEQQTAESLRG